MRYTTRLKLFTASALMMIISSLPSVSLLRSATAQTSKDTKSKSQTQTTSPNKSAKPTSQFPDKPQRAYAPHWTTENGFTTIIYIRNVQMVNAVRAKLSLVLKHRTITLSERRIDPAQTISIDVGRVLAANGERAEQQGGAVIDYMANSAGGINAFEQVVNEVKSLSFSFPFMQDGARHEGPLDAVAWYYDYQTDAFISLQNTTNKAVIVTPTIFVNRRPHSLESRNLKPNAVITIKLPELENFSYDPQPHSAGVRIEHNGGAGAVVAQGWSMNARIGFSTAFAFHQGGCACKPGESHHLYGAGVPIGDGGMTAPGAVFEPLLALRNNSSNPLTVIPIFKYQENGEKKVSLPAITLEPQETTVKNLRKYQLDGTIPATVMDGNIELVYDSELGALIAELSSVDVNGSFVSGVPLTCNGNGALHMAYWRTDGDWDSMLTVENVLDQENVVEITISYPGGLYVINKTLAAGETTMLSVKELQHNQTPDKNGHTIPVTATMGGMNVWSDNVYRGLVINGMIFNSVTRTCGYCGAFGYVYDKGLSDFPRNCYQGFAGEYEVGDSIQVHMWLELSTNQCGGDAVQSLHTSTPLILQLTDSTSVEAIGVGSGMVDADSQGTWSEDEQSCEYGGGYHLHANGEINVKVHVSHIQYQSDSNYVDISSNPIYVLKGSTVNFKAIPKPSNATWPTNQPVWSGSSGASGTGDTTTVTFNTTSTSTSDYKTVIATAGNSVTVNVLVYELTPTTTPRDNFTGRSTTDYGLKELVDLSFTTSPNVTAAQAGGLNWSKKTGVGTVTPTSGNVGTGTYDAEDTAGAVTLSIKVVDGPSKGQERTVDRNIVAPNDATMVQAAGTGIRHIQDYISVGFKGSIYLSPKNVSFASISWREGSVIAVASGCWANENGSSHPIGNLMTVSGCNTTTGCQVNTTDTVQAGDRGPYLPPNPTYCTGDFEWDIPWQYSTDGGTTWTQFTVAIHHQWADTAPNLGRANIQKKGAGPFSKHATDPTSTY